MQREPIVQNVMTKPLVTEGVIGDVVHVIDVHEIYWGTYRKTLVGVDRQPLWMPADHFGNIF